MLVRRIKQSLSKLGEKKGVKMEENAKLFPEWDDEKWYVDLQEELRDWELKTGIKIELEPPMRFGVFGEQLPPWRIRVYIKDEQLFTSERQLWEYTQRLKETLDKAAKITSLLIQKGYKVNWR